MNYTYDALYRLSAETIAGGSVNGVIGYQYDAVSNRVERTSTVAPVPAATSSYDADDRLRTDNYDQDGNTIASGGNTYLYDFENHLQTENGGAVTVVYDGDGNRVSTTASGITTKYLIDDRNLTGYVQVLEEISAGAVQRVYTFGLNRISQSQASGTSFYGYDGHGSVRLLTDATGVITDRYDYDAFGNILSQVGTTQNVYLYSGEQNDPNLGFYYLRSRYMNPGTGRFFSADPLEGSSYEPRSLHRYLYTSDNPINAADPSGKETLMEVSLSIAVYVNLQTVEIGYDLPLLNFAVASAAITDCVLNPATDLLNTALNAVDGPAQDIAVQEYIEAEKEINQGYIELAKAGIKVYTDVSWQTALKPLSIGISFGAVAIESELQILLGPGWVALAEESETMAGYVSLGIKAETIKELVDLYRQAKKAKSAIKDLRSNTTSGSCKALRAADFLLGGDSGAK